MLLSIITFFRFLSKPIVVLTLPLSTLRKGSANNTTFAVPPIEVELEVERGGVAHAVCYWYRVTMVEPGSALLSDSGITSAIKLQEMKNIQKQKHKNENDIENVNNNKYQNVLGYENKYKNENEKQMDRDKEKKRNNVLNEMFPYTLDTGPYGTGRWGKNMGNLDCHIDDGKKGEDASEEGREREGNEEHTHHSTSQSHPPSSSSPSSSSFLPSSSPSCPSSSPSPSPSSSSPSPPSSSHTGLPSHYRQAATLLKEAVAVRVEDTVLIEVGIDICFGVLCRVISHFT